MNDTNKQLWPGWETVRLIGRGSFGAVYEIERKLFEDDEPEKAALKLISIPQNDSDIEEMYNDGYDDESVTSTFKSHLKSIVAEYSLMRKMNGSSNIVNCDDVRYVQHDDGIGWDIYIKMELLTPLAKALPAQIPEAQVIQIAKDMSAALELCSKYNIVHRDIKPQNIFVSENGDYKLGDFGIAKTVEKTMGGTKTGTYKYMAPEVYNNQPYNNTADIYSLGLVLYWLLNERRMPFMPLPPAALRPGMDEEARQRRFSGEQIPAPKNGSEELQRIVLKACAFDPADRYQSAAEMHEDLLRLSGGTVAKVAPKASPEEAEEEEEKTVGPFFKAAPVAEEEEEEKTVGPVFKAAPVVEEEEEEKTVGPVFRSAPITEEEEDEEEEETGMQKPWIAIAVIAAVVCVALIASFILPSATSSKKPSQTQSQSVQNVQQATENVLMQDSYTSDGTARDILGSDRPYDEVLSYCAQHPVFGSEIPRSEIKTITFLDRVNAAPDDAWDVSASQNGSVLAWVVPNGELYDLYLAGEGGVNAAYATENLFAYYINLEEIHFNGNFYTTGSTSMRVMFAGCTNLKQLDLSDFDTSLVTNMRSMFYRCYNLHTLDVSNFDTSMVTDMLNMFYFCNSLTKLDVSEFDTSNVTNMASMFYECRNLTELDVSGFDTSKVTNMYRLFADCCRLQELDVSGFDTSNVTIMEAMFYNCTSLQELDISGFDTSRVMDMESMFCYCSSLRELDVSGFDTFYVTNMNNMFGECNSLRELDVSHFDLSSAIEYAGFYIDNGVVRYEGY